MMRARPYSHWFSRLFILLSAGLGFTGLMQMPLARRYYLTDLPGMAWSGDFFFVHRLHYVFAALFLLLLGVVVANWLRQWRKHMKLTSLGLLRIVTVGALVVSGGLRIYRNLPGVTMHPDAVMAVEWLHLVSAIVLGVLALIALIRARSAYAVRR